MILLVLKSEFERTKELNTIIHYNDLKINWKNCVMSDLDLNYCTEKYKIYPNGELIRNKFEYLKENNLNIFSNQN